MLCQQILRQPQIGSGDVPDQAIAAGRRELAQGVLRLHGWPWLGRGPSELRAALQA
jgi:hypothetical protein